jgi:hypothetical protein
VPPIVRKQIEDLRVGRSEPFTIITAEKKNGTRRTIEWQVAANGRTGSERKQESAEDSGRSTGGGPEKRPVADRRYAATVYPMRSPRPVVASSFIDAASIAKRRLDSLEKLALLLISPGPNVHH